MFDRPIIFFDLETTGLKTEEARIVQISLIKLDTSLNLIDKITSYINPEMEIPAGATAIHGITNNIVKSAPSFKDIAKTLSDYMRGCDLAGFNIGKFDIPVLLQEFTRASVFFSTDFRVLDVSQLYRMFSRRNLASAYVHYLFKDMENAHDAEADNMATIEIFKAQLKRHAHIDLSPEALHQITYGGTPVDLEGKFMEIDDSTSSTGKTIIFTFGTHKDEPVAKHMGYLNWIANKDSFTMHVRAVAQELYEQVYGNKNSK